MPGSGPRLRTQGAAESLVGGVAFGPSPYPACSGSRNDSGAAIRPRLDPYSPLADPGRPRSSSGRAESRSRPYLARRLTSLPRIRRSQPRPSPPARRRAEAVQPAGVQLRARAKQGSPRRRAPASRARHLRTPAFTRSGMERRFLGLSPGRPRERQPRTTWPASSSTSTGRTPVRGRTGRLRDPREAGPSRRTGCATRTSSSPVSS